MLRRASCKGPPESAGSIAEIDSSDLDPSSSFTRRQRTRGPLWPQGSVDTAARGAVPYLAHDVHRGSAGGGGNCEDIPGTPWEAGPVKPTAAGQAQCGSAVPIPAALTELQSIKAIPPALDGTIQGKSPTYLDHAHLRQRDAQSWISSFASPRWLHPGSLDSTPFLSPCGARILG